MNRRTFFASLLAGAVLDPERLLWVPGRKMISIPGASLWESPDGLKYFEVYSSSGLLTSDVAFYKKWGRFTEACTFGRHKPPDVSGLSAFDANALIAFRDRLYPSARRMKYLNPSFTIGPPQKVTACEACVYGRGKHAEWCEKAPEEIMWKGWRGRLHGYPVQRIETADVAPYGGIPRH